MDSEITLTLVTVMGPKVIKCNPNDTLRTILYGTEDSLLSRSRAICFLDKRKLNNHLSLASQDVKDGSKIVVMIKGRQLKSRNSNASSSKDDVCNESSRLYDLAFQVIESYRCKDATGIYNILLENQDISDDEDVLEAPVISKSTSVSSDPLPICWCDETSDGTDVDSNCSTSGVDFETPTDQTNSDFEY